MTAYQSHPKDLLRQSEIAGLQLLAWLHFGLALVDIIGAVFTARGILLISNLIIALIPLGIFLFIRLRVEQFVHLEQLGLLIALFDSILLLWFPISWYLFQGNGNAPELLVKNDLVIFYLLLAAIHSITLRPKQPLLVGMIGALVMAGCYFWAMAVGLPPVTNDWLTSINTRQLDVTSFWFKILFMLPFGCGTMALLAGRGRQLVTHSAAQERSITALSRYFSPTIVDELINNDVLNSALNSQQREVAVLFVDLASFTELSEKLPPDEVVLLLADYYRRMVACVFANQGSVDKFLGDGLMATFNTLGNQLLPARQAVLAGLAMQDALRELNGVRKLQNTPPLKQRIGIHFGTAIVGNVGTPQRMEFTVIGDTVNTASRLQEICKQLETDFLISAAVYQQFPLLPVKDMGEINIRGKTDPMRIYAVTSAKS